MEFFLTLSSWIISMIYFSYLTPKLIYLTKLWKSLALRQKVSKQATLSTWRMVRHSLNLKVLGTEQWVLLLSLTIVNLVTYAQDAKNDNIIHTSLVL